MDAALLGRMSIVIAEDVRRAHHSAFGSVQVLDGVSFAVRPGELVLLEGPSGSGKTTLVSILAGLLRADSGRITLAGERLDGRAETALAEIRRRSVGFVYQSFQLFEALTARDNVAEILALRGRSLAAARREASERLAAVGLSERAHHRPAELSAGQKQRVAIARAFAGDPRIVFADEPTAALDPKSAREVMALLRAAVSGDRCALVVTHDPALRAYADRVLRLAEGRISEITP